MIHIGINAHLLSNQPGYRSAGIHTVLHQLLTHLPANAPDDWRFTAMIGGANPAEYAGIQLRRSRLDTESPLKRIIWEQLLQPFQLGNFDLYHAGAFVAPVILNKPMVVTIYDLTFLRYPERLTRARRLYLQTFTERTCRHAERILAISHSTKADLVSLLGIPADKVDVTPLGYDRQRMQPLDDTAIEAFKRAKGLPERFWLFLGTIEPRKNLVTLLEAYARLAPQDRLPLVLAGGRGWLWDELERVIDQYQLREQITFTGFVPDDEKALWYNSAEVFLYPSVFEGFGLPVLEAMACGTPVITSNVSSLPEVAEGAGICLDPHDVSLWTETLRRVYHDGAWRVSAKQSGLEKARLFEWEQTAQLTIASYRRALFGH